MRRLVLIGAAAGFVALALAACGGQSHGARVAGVVKLCGGLANKCFTEPVYISIARSDGNIVARSHPTNGRFTFNLEPGDYTVSARADTYPIGTVSVLAVAGRTTRANITAGGVE